VNVLVFGASGATGRHIVAEAVTRGHEVVAFVREGSATTSIVAQRFLIGDATVSSDVDAGFAGKPDVVISALGARSLKKTRLLETAVKNIIGSMHRNETFRLIELSAAGTFGLPGASRITIPERVAFEILRRTILRNSFNDHAAADRLIHESGLDWTIVQPPELSDDDARGYCIALDGLSRGGPIARVDVAAAFIDIMERGSFLRQSPFVVSAERERACRR
jgi:putative NADH-flavin reductase